MEIEQFIEEDIKRFLDAQRREQPATHPPPRPEVVMPEEVAIYAPTKDYEKELNNAIKDHNKAAAEAVIAEAKASLSQYPAGTPEHTTRKLLIEKLYHRFQQVFNEDAESRVAALAEELKLINNVQQSPPANAPVPSAPVPSAPSSASPAGSATPPVNASGTPPPAASLIRSAATAPKARSQTSTPNPTNPTTAYPPNAHSPTAYSPNAHPPNETAKRSQPPPSQQQPSPQGDIVLEALEADLNDIETLIATNAYKKAISAYKEVRTRLNVEQLPPATRATITARMKALHDKIAEGLKRYATATTKKSAATRFAEHLRAAEELLKNKEITEAMYQYKEARALLQELAEKDDAKKRLLSLYTAIKNAELSMHHAPKARLLDEAEKRLVGKP